MDELQPALFAQLPPQPPMVDPLEKRRKEQQRVYDQSNDDWKVAYENFVLEFLERQDASAETIREAYMADPSQPQTGSQQASGQIFARLRRAKKIVEVSRERSRKFGNFLAVYRLARTDESSN